MFVSGWRKWWDALVVRNLIESRQAPKTSRSPRLQEPFIFMWGTRIARFDVLYNESMYKQTEGKDSGKQGSGWQNCRW